MASVRASFENFNQMSEVLLDHLKCVFCQTLVKAGKPRWYQCSAHHQICQDCREVSRKDNCTCGKLISENHCAMTEKLVKLIIKIRCGNTSRGCQEVLTEEAMICHEKDCIYRLVQCPGLIWTKVPFHELLQHMKKWEQIYKEFSMPKEMKIVHQFEMTETQFKDGGFIFIPIHIIYEDKSFFAIGTHDNRDSLYYWVQLLGSKLEAKNYQYDLCFDGVNSNSKMVYSGDVFSIDEKFVTIVNAKNSFVTNFEAFKTQFMDENRNFKVTISIRNMKEEVKDIQEQSAISETK